ncbi:MAG: porin family protein [Dysgonomonas sp.]
MKTVKVILFAVALLIGANANAQLGILPFSFGIKGGVNSSNFGGDAKDTSSKAGWNAGLTLDVSLPASFYVASGVELTTKGAKFEGLGFEEKASANPLYIQVPIHLGYKISLVPTTKLVIHAGPYWAYGLTGKVKVDGEKTDFFGKNGIAKKNDFGIGVGAGVKVLILNIGVGYDFGLANISDVDGTKIRNRNAYVSAGISF